MIQSLTIGQAAKQAGVSVETIRFYERQDLIERPARKESGYRLFSRDDIRRLLFIQQAKSLGFSLAEIKSLLSLRADPDSSTREVKQFAASKLDDIEKKIKMLQRMKKTLKSLVGQCPGEGPKHQCPILEALDRNVGNGGLIKSK